MEWTPEQLKEMGLCTCGKPRQKNRAKCSRCRYRTPPLKPEPKIVGPIGLDWDRVLWVIQKEVARQMYAVKN